MFRLLNFFFLSGGVTIGHITINYSYMYQGKFHLWIAPILKSMAESWEDAKECARKEALPQVYHDCDANTYGACNQGERQGSFKGGVFTEHRCLCMPAHLTAEEIKEKERKFLAENPDW
jgi:hypothetical protein